MATRNKLAESLVATRVALGPFVTAINMLQVVPREQTNQLSKDIHSDMVLAASKYTMETLPEFKDALVNLSGWMSAIAILSDKGFEEALPRLLPMMQSSVHHFDRLHRQHQELNRRMVKVGRMLQAEETKQERLAKDAEEQRKQTISSKEEWMDFCGKACRGTVGGVCGFAGMILASEVLIPAAAVSLLFGAGSAMAAIYSGAAAEVCDVQQRWRSEEAEQAKNELAEVKESRGTVAGMVSAIKDLQKVVQDIKGMVTQDVMAGEAGTGGERAARDVLRRLKGEVEAALAALPDLQSTLEDISEILSD